MTAQHRAVGHYRDKLNGFLMVIAGALFTADVVLIVVAAIRKVVPW